MYEDLKLCFEQAEALGVPIWVGNTVLQICASAISQGAGPRNYSTIIQYWRKSRKVLLEGISEYMD